MRRSAASFGLPLTLVFAISVVIGTMLFVPAPQPAFAATFTVTDPGDTEYNGCGTGVCTLREAIDEASAGDEDSHRYRRDEHEYDRSGHRFQWLPVRLLQQHLDSSSLDDAVVTINGHASDGSGSVFVLQGDGAITVSFERLNITGGDSDRGGGVYAGFDVSVDFTDVTIASNVARPVLDGETESWSAATVEASTPPAGSRRPR